MRLFWHGDDNKRPTHQKTLKQACSWPLTIEKAEFCNTIIPLQRLCDVHVVWPSGGDFSIFLLSLQQVVLKKGPVDSIKDELMSTRDDIIPKDQLTRVDFSWFASGQSQVPKKSSWLASRRRCLVAGESRHSITGPPSCTCRWQIIKEQDALTIRHVSVKIVETMIKVFLFQPQHCVSGCPPQLCRLSGDLSQRRNGRWPYSWTTELCKLHSSKGKISQCRRFSHETSTCIYLSLWLLPGMDGEGFFHGAGQGQKSAGRGTYCVYQLIEIIWYSRGNLDW